MLLTKTQPTTTRTRSKPTSVEGQVKILLLITIGALTLTSALQIMTLMIPPTGNDLCPLLNHFHQRD